MSEDIYDEYEDAEDDVLSVQPYPPWRAALESFLRQGWKCGEVIPHEWFWEAFGMKKPLADTPLALAEREKYKFLKQFEPLRFALLKEHKIYLFNEFSVGYRIVPPSDQTRTAYAEGVREVRKAMRKMAAGITFIDLGALTDQQRRENAEAMARLSMLETMRRKVRRLPGPPEEE